MIAIEIALATGQYSTNHARKLLGATTSDEQILVFLDRNIPVASVLALFFLLIFKGTVDRRLVYEHFLEFALVHFNQLVANV